jgi:hypothetical protein
LPGSAPSVNGSLIFGIGTQANNAPNGATVFRFDNSGFFATQFNGQSLPYSFVDTGSAVISFPDKSIATCKDYTTLYCPPKTVNLSATIVGANGSKGAVSFSVGNTDTLFAQHPGDNVFSTICGSTQVSDPTSPIGPNSFDWGLNFFFGRNVFSAIDGTNTPLGPGPYVAY